MEYTDLLIHDFYEPAYQAAFKAYYAELGVRVTNWDGLFAEMSVGEDAALVRLDEEGEVVGFLLFVASDTVTAWKGFFTTRLGCVEEFWIAPKHRRQGHGAALLHRAEEKLREEGCAYAILTTDTAPEFYRRHGYTQQRGIRARNNADVYLKPL